MAGRRVTRTKCTTEDYLPSSSNSVYVEIRQVTKPKRHEPDTNRKEDEQQRQKWNSKVQNIFREQQKATFVEFPWHGAWGVCPVLGPGARITQQALCFHVRISLLVQYHLREWRWSCFKYSNSPHTLSSINWPSLQSQPLTLLEQPYAVLIQKPRGLCCPISLQIRNMSRFLCLNPKHYY